MPTTTRRSVMKRMMAFPVFAAFQKWDVANAKKSMAHHVLGIQTFRFLNTAEFRFNYAFQRYAGLDELRNSDVVDTMVYQGPAERMWGGRALYEQLRFDQDEILPGWKLKFGLSHDGSGYLITLRDTSEWKLGALSTDDGGIIYRGDSLAETVGSTSLSAANALENPMAMGSKSQTHPAVRLLMAAFAAFPPQGTCSGCLYPPGCCCKLLDLPCCTSANCCVGDCSECGGGRCCNCGCGSCPWDCCGGSGCAPPC